MPAAGSEVETGVAYTADGEGATLDFFPPFRSDGPGRPPLVVFVSGGFWGAGPARGPELDRWVVRPLRSEGAAVAIVRHRPAPAHPHPAGAEDVAAALAWLMGRADRLGFDPARVVLSGHGSGAQLAALVALDPRYLEARGLSPRQLAAVVPISGLYDLESDDLPRELRELVRQAFPGAAQRRDGSPLRHVRADAPPFLVLAGSADAPGFAAGALGLSEALRAAGHPSAETFLATGRDHGSILDLSDLRNSARTHLLATAGLGPEAGRIGELVAARRTWRSPPWSTQGFWKHPELVRSHEADERFLDWVRRLFAAGRPGAARLTASRFDAVDLFAWLEAEGPGEPDGAGWLVLRNVRGEQGVLDLEALRPFQPVLVVGIDGKRNLFEIVDLYHTRRRYSWREPEPEPWLMARPLGGFVYFLAPPPPELAPTVFGLFALVPESLQRSAGDPRAPLETGLDPRVHELVTREKACVSCHRFRGVGGRAGHLRARDGELVGGFALALEEYPPEAWRRYVYDPLAVAEEIGATAVVLDPADRDLLYHAVVEARER